jgi:glycosyltransferase involved in cell wall biosynthesis
MMSRLARVQDEAMPAARPRIVHLGPDPAGAGGMAAVVRALMTSRLSARYVQEAIPTYRVDTAWRRHAVFARAIAELFVWCLRPGPRLAHVHTAARGSLYRKSVVVLVAKALRRPVVLHLHAGAADIAEFDARIGAVRRAAFRLAFASADRVISVSAAGAQAARRHFGATDVEVIPNAAPVVAAAAEEGEVDGHLRILYLGGFEDPAKGGAILLAALPAVLAAVPAVSVAIAGPGEPPDGAIGDGPAVRWMGWLDEGDKARAFSSAAIVAFPSVSEGLPVALLEAMAHGRAIVATRAGGMPDVLTDGVDAVLVPVGDPKALAEALIALASDAPRRAQLGRAARARAGRLGEDAVAAPLDRLYTALLDPDEARRPRSP